MRTTLTLMLLCSTALARNWFDVDDAVAPPSPPEPPPVKTGCQCKHNCGRENCQCQTSGACPASNPFGITWAGQAALATIPAPEKPPVRSGYPLRGNRWSHPGIAGREAMVSHLSSGQHSGKFDRNWLSTLSLDELESLHSDDHGGTVKLPFNRTTVSQANRDQYVIEVYTTPGCLPCEQLKRSLGNGDSQVSVVYIVGNHPQNNRGTYPFLWDRKQRKRAWGSGYKTTAILKQTFAIPVTAPAQEREYGAVSAGTIDKATVDLALSMFYPRPGSMSFGNDALTYPSTVTVMVPKDVKASWSTANETTTLKFTGNKPRVRWGVIDQVIDGVGITKNQVTVLLPWMPDLTLDVQ